MKQMSRSKLTVVALTGVVAVGLVFAAAVALPLFAQTAISADGVVESTAGGFKFPDGTTQLTAAPSSTAPVEDTGQQGCWDVAGDPIDCGGTGQDGDVQAGVNWPTPRFTDHGNGTVTDNLTGLIWLKLANCFGTSTWEQALLDANGLSTGSCNLSDGSVAGDWRLPNLKELLSLLDYGESSPALPVGHPFTGVSPEFHWSSTSRVSGASFAWGSALGTGTASINFKNDPFGVWPVRGGQ